MKCSGSEDPGDREALLLPGVGTIWSEHSERNGIASFAAILGESEENQNRLGRWSAGTSEGYVRTTRGIVERVQRDVAAAIRRSAGSADIVDDEEVLAQVREKALELKYSTDEAEAQVTRLRWCRPQTSRASDPLEIFSPGAVGGGPDTPRPEDDSSDAGSLISIPETGPTEGYFVTITGTVRLRRLHYGGRCGITAATCVELGLDLPPTTEYDSVCRRCWPRELPGEEDLDLAGIEDSDDSDDQEDGTETEAD